jgi:hypothetical protein
MKRFLQTALVAATVAAPAMLYGAQAFAMDRHIVLVNHSRETITEFHASNVGSTSWEEDILGDGVLQPGRWVRINLDDRSGYCRFDFKTVTESGATIIRRAVNVCELETYTITD